MTGSLAAEIGFVRDATFWRCARTLAAMFVAEKNSTHCALAAIFLPLAGIRLPAQHVEDSAAAADFYANKVGHNSSGLHAASVCNNSMCGIAAPRFALCMQPASPCSGARAALQHQQSAHLSSATGVDRYGVSAGQQPDVHWLDDGP